MKSIGTISQVADLLQMLPKHTKHWGFATRAGRPWFRGQRNKKHAPMPSIFRHSYDEHGLTNMFRNRAPSFEPVPDRSGHTDEWLFLMQHYGVPTRLLDWTESALAGLFFAVFQRDYEVATEPTDAALWLLHPLELNALEGSIEKHEFPNTWANFEGNLVRHNIDRAFWTAGSAATKLPIAIQTTYSKPLMGSQKSCFTIHGMLEQDFESLFAGTTLEREGYFIKYEIPAKEIPRIANELDTLGITFSVLFPGLAGLSTELRTRFRTDIDP